MTWKTTIWRWEQRHWQNAVIHGIGSVIICRSCQRAWGEMKCVIPRSHRGKVRQLSCRWQHLIWNDKIEFIRWAENPPLHRVWREREAGSVAFVYTRCSRYESRQRIFHLLRTRPAPGAISGPIVDDWMRPVNIYAISRRIEWWGCLGTSIVRGRCNCITHDDVGVLGGVGGWRRLGIIIIRRRWPPASLWDPSLAGELLQPASRAWYLVRCVLASLSCISWFPKSCPLYLSVTLNFGPSAMCTCQDWTQRGTCGGYQLCHY